VCPSAHATFSVGGSLALNGYGTFQSSTSFPGQTYSYLTGLSSIEYVFSFPSGSEKTSGPVTGPIGNQVPSTANGPWTEIGRYTARVYLLSNPRAGIFSRVSVLDEYTWAIAPSNYSLTVNWRGETANPGTGTVSGGGLFPGSFSAPVTATPNPGSEFVRWEGDPTESNAPSTSVPINNAPRSVTAVFRKIITEGFPPKLTWTSAPVSAQTGAAYSVNVAAHDDDGDLVAISITKNGTTFAAADGGNGLDQTAGGQTTDGSAGAANYVATATDALGLSTSISHTVTVKARVTASISADPTSFTQGATTTISWNSGDATSVSVTGPKLSSSSPGGSQDISGLSAGTYTYTITAQGFNGPVTQSVQVTVAAPPVSAWISADPSDTMAPGNTTISWDTSNASSVSVTGPGFSTSSASSGSQTVSGLSAGTYTYTITAEGTDGPATDSTTVTVTAPIATTFSFSNTSFTYDGSSHSPTVSPNPSAATYSTVGTRTATAAGSYSFTATANGNYAGSARCDWSVDPKPVTFTIGGNLNPSYDGSPKPALISASDPNATYTTTYTGSGGTTYNTSSTAPTRAGTYTVSVMATGNYSGSASATLTIAKGTPSLSWTAPAPIAYGTALNSAQLNATATVPGTFSYSPAAGTIVPPGTAALQVNFTPTDSANYTPATASTTVTVNKAVLTVTADNQTRTYGTANPALTVTCTGFVNGETAASLTSQPIATTAAITTSPVGTYTIMPSGAVSPHYTFVYVNGTLRVTKATAVITLGNLSHVWDGAPKSASATTVPAGLPVGVTYNGGATAPLAVGSYAVAATISDANYAGTASGTLVISKATPALTWATPAAITYGTALGPTQLNASANTPGSFTYTPAAGTVLAAGSRTLSVTFTPTDSADYSAVTATVALQIYKATPPVTWTTPAPITYGTSLGAAQLNATASIPGSFVYTPASGTLLNAGPQQLSVVFTPTDTANYGAGTAAVTLAVTKRALTVTAASVAKTYGSENPPFTASFTGFVNGDTTAGITGAPSFTTTATVSSSPGAYAVTPATGTLAAANYSFGPFVDGTLTINKAALVVTANDQTRTYGGANPLLTPRYSGFVNGDTPSSLTGAPALSTSATMASGAGVYPITAAIGSLTSSRYTFSFANGALTVTKASLTVTAANATRTYGAANPSFAVSFSGFLNGDTATAVSGNPSITSTATAGSATGSYPITPAIGSLTAANYSFGPFVPGTLVITKAPLAVTANNQTRSYGQANPTLDVVFSGFVNGDTTSVISGAAAVTTTATAASVVGTYAITPAAGSLTAANYSFGPFNNGTLAITKATLTATADNKSRPYGATNSPLTISYSGWMNGDSPSAITPPSASTTATASSTVGTYPIILMGGSAVNYALTLRNGALTVSKALLTLTADNQTRMYGAANPALTYHLIGFLNGDSAASLTGAPAITTSATATSNVGTYPIAVSPGTLGSANYEFSVANGTLTVQPKPVTFTFGNLGAEYDGTTKTATVAASDSAATFSADLVKGPDAGTYAVSAVATGNYAGVGNATLTITPAPITFTFADLAQVYDGDEKSATVRPSRPAATYTADVRKGPDAGNYTVSATATGNYTGSSSATLIIAAAPQTISLSPSTLTLFAGQPATFTAVGGNNAYRWIGDAGVAGQGGSATLSFPTAGTYTVSVTNIASNNYLASNTASADVTVVAARQVNSFQPLASTYTVSDASSPMNGQTYRRIWQEAGWTAYLGRAGVRFQVKGQAWPSVKSVEIHAKPPGGTWTRLAAQDTTASDTAVDAIFSVKLGDSAPGQPLVPLSYYEGKPQTGPWSFRARVQDTNSVWSEFSPEVLVNVILPVSSKTVSGQTVPPAGELGAWFTASPVQTFTLQFWIP
jgi:hypothetical protein